MSTVIARARGYTVCTDSRPVAALAVGSPCVLVRSDWSPPVSFDSIVCVRLSLLEYRCFACLPHVATTPCASEAVRTPAPVGLSLELAIIDLRLRRDATERSRARGPRPSELSLSSPDATKIKIKNRN